MVHMSTTHQLLHLEENLGKAKLRIYKLEERGRQDRLRIVFFEKDWPDITEEDAVILRLRWVFKQYRKFWRGIQEQYGVYA